MEVGETANGWDFGIASAVVENMTDSDKKRFEGFKTELKRLGSGPRAGEVMEKYFVDHSSVSEPRNERVYDSQKSDTNQ